jgi:hypothetical protein
MPFETEKTSFYVKILMEEIIWRGLLGEIPVSL